MSSQKYQKQQKQLKQEQNHDKKMVVNAGTAQDWKFINEGKRNMLFGFVGNEPKSMVCFFVFFLYFFLYFFVFSTSLWVLVFSLLILLAWKGYTSG